MKITASLFDNDRYTSTGELDDRRWDIQPIESVTEGENEGCINISLDLQPPGNGDVSAVFLEVDREGLRWLIDQLESVYKENEEDPDWK